MLENINHKLPSREYMEDCLGPPSHITDDAGIKTCRYLYDVFGSLIGLRWCQLTEYSLYNRSRFGKYGVRPLEEIINDLPDEWKNIVLFNMDIFTFQLFRF